MKKFICILLSVLFILSLTACNKKAEVKKPQKNSPTKENSSTQDQPIKMAAYPAPAFDNYLESDNKLGACYNFTLEEFNSLLNASCVEVLGDSTNTFFDYKAWELISSDVVDDSGIKYMTYCYDFDMVKITASVEKESKKVMSVSCCASYEQFEDGDSAFEQDVMFTSAVVAMTANGYHKDNLDFLFYIFYDCAKTNKRFMYHNSLYMMDYVKNEGDTSVVMFTTSMIASDKTEEWNLTDYTKYDNSYVKAYYE